MQISPMWDIKLLLALRINESSRFSSLFIEPACYISSCCFYQWIDLWFISIFLYEFCEIIDIIEERYPNVIGRVMCLQFSEDIIPSFMIWLGDEFFKLICCTLFWHLINTKLIKNIIRGRSSVFGKTAAWRSGYSFCLLCLLKLVKFDGTFVLIKGYCH